MGQSSGPGNADTLYNTVCKQTCYYDGTEQLQCTTARRISFGTGMGKRSSASSHEGCDVVWQCAVLQCLCFALRCVPMAPSRPLAKTHPPGPGTPSSPTGPRITSQLMAAQNLASQNPTTPPPLTLTYKTFLLYHQPAAGCVFFITQAWSRLGMKYIILYNRRFASWAPTTC